MKNSGKYFNGSLYESVLKFKREFLLYEDFSSLVVKTSFTKMSFKELIRKFDDEHFFRYKTGMIQNLLQEMHNRYARKYNICPVAVFFSKRCSRFYKDTLMFVSVRPWLLKKEQNMVSNKSIHTRKIKASPIGFYKGIFFTKCVKYSNVGIITFMSLLHETRHIFQLDIFSSLVHGAKIDNFVAITAFYGILAMLLISYEDEEYFMNLNEIDAKMFMFFEVEKLIKRRYIKNTNEFKFYLLRKQLSFLSSINSKRNGLSFSYLNKKIKRNISIIKKELQTGKYGIIGNHLLSIESAFNYDDYFAKLEEYYNYFYNNLNNLQDYFLKNLTADKKLESKIRRSKLSIDRLDYIINLYSVNNFNKLPKGKYEEIII